MDTITQNKIIQISRCLWAYGVILILGVLWDLVDGEIESARDAIRGVVRSAVMIYLAKTIWDLKRLSWWVMTICSCLFSVFGVIAVVLLFSGGIVTSQVKYVFMSAIIIPTLLLLVRTFMLLIQKDVKSQFVN